MDAITWTAALVGLSVLIVNAVKQEAWAPSVLAAVVLGVTAALFALGQYLDGTLVFDSGLLNRFFLAVVGNQTVYLLFKNTALLEWLEGLGQSPGVPLSTRR